MKAISSRIKAQRSGTSLAHAMVAAIAASLVLAACSSNPITQPQSELMQIKPGGDDKGHAALIESHSAGDSDYSGFYNTFEYKATILNSIVREALVSRQAEYYKWDEPKTATELEKARQELTSETEVFLSFFTPERKNDNLADTKSIWRVLLDVGGHRYVGKVKRLRLLLAELQALYPYHTRWNTPYLVSFPVPATAVENQEMTLTVTGPLGARTVILKPIR